MAGFQRTAIRLRARDRLLDQLELLGVHLPSLEEGEPGHIPTRAGETRDEPLVDGIDRIYHHNGDLVRGVLHGPRRRRRDRHDDLRFEPDQLGREGWEPVVLSLGRSVLDDKVLPRHPPTLAERLLECLKQMLRRLAADGQQKPDPVDLPRLLRLGSDRRSEQTKGEGGDERDDDELHDHSSKQSRALRR